MRPIRRKLAQNGGYWAALAATITGLLLLVSGAYGQAPASKAVGTVKSVSGNSLVLTSDSGTETTVTFGDSARIVRATPGQSDLKSAPPIQISDIQVGDRVAARGQAKEGGSFVATVAIVMKQGDIADVHRRELEEWRRGTGGIVENVDASAGTITIVNSLATGGKPIVIHLSPGAEIKRYPPNSAKFDDAKPSALHEIKLGDQVTARGTKNTDGTEFTAQAVVSGSFKYIVGTVVSSDGTDNSVTILDLQNRKPLTVKIGQDSLVRKLPQGMAMRFALWMKGGAEGVRAGTAGAAGSGGAGWQGRGQGSSEAGGGGQALNCQGAAGQGGSGRVGAGGGKSIGGGQGGNSRGNGPPDFQQMLARMPAVSISDLNKGEAVMLVATEGTASVEPVAIKLVAGVEPILSAAPAGSNAASTILSPWNLSAPSGAGGDAAGQ
jgi:hypothetical protein